MSVVYSVTCEQCAWWILYTGIDFSITGTVC